MSIDKPGATNAAIYATEILATSDPSLRERLVQYKAELERSVAEKSARVKQNLGNAAR
jgi:phosphoribosylcarboxyaminoimidazole (NCAIR) mutase